MLPKPHARLIEDADEFNRVTLSGNVHPLAAAAADSAPLIDEMAPMEHLILHLTGDAEQEARLAEFIAQLNDPTSANYHKYLTTQAFAAHFGVASEDIAKVSSWLRSYGFVIDEVPAGNRSIVFSGTAAQVSAAFKTELRLITVAGKQHVANTTDPQIPAAS